MEEFNTHSEIDAKENYQSLTNKPIVKNCDDCISPKKITPLMKLNENILTPKLGNNLMLFHTPGTPFAQTPTHDPMIETPNGSKIIHPLLADIIRNLDKSIMSPNLFTIKETLLKDDSVLSPDLAGELFPVYIDVDADTQYDFEAALFKKYEKYCNKKSDMFFKQGIILPSPEHSDSGIGTSLQMSNPSVTESDHNFLGPMSLLLHKTPPSKYKWNRDEFRQSKVSPPTMDFMYDESGDDEEGMDFISHKYNMESTKIFDNSLGLEHNMSMRKHSVIASPMFDNDGRNIDDIDFEDMETGGSYDELRSSPSWKFNGSAMDDLAMSPIVMDKETKRRHRGNCGDNEDYFGC